MERRYESAPGFRLDAIEDGAHERALDFGADGLKLFALGEPVECTYKIGRGAAAVLVQLDGVEDVRAMRDGLTRWLAEYDPSERERCMLAIVNMEKETVR
jgi:hypothetical protein